MSLNRQTEVGSLHLRFKVGHLYKAEMALILVFATLNFECLKKVSVQVASLGERIDIALAFFLLNDREL